MSLDWHQQQVALAVAVLAVHQLHDQLPFLTLCFPSQSVSRDWRQKEWVVARLHQDANFPECPKRNANCLSQETVSPTSDTGIVETVMMIHWRDRRVCRVCVSCHKFGDSTSGDVVKTCQDRFKRLPCESRKPQPQPLTTAFIIFSDMLSNEFCLQLDTLSGCAK